jgi:hypothetical protein
MSGRLIIAALAGLSLCSLPIGREAGLKIID